MSAYEKLNDTTTVEKNILREVFLDRIWELEDQIQNATKLTKVKDLEKLVTCNMRWLSWIEGPPTDTVH